MEQEEKKVILTPELLQEIVELASVTAVESYQKELDKAKQKAKREQEEAKKKNLYNIRVLLENYRAFVTHSKKAVYDATQAATEDEDLDKLVEEMMRGPEGRVHVPVVNSIMESAARTRTMVMHIEALMAAYKTYCQRFKRADYMRRYRTIYNLYIADERKDELQIAAEEGVDVTTVYRDRKAAIAQIGGFIFGIYGFSEEK